MVNKGLSVRGAGSRVEKQLSGNIYWCFWLRTLVYILTTRGLQILHRLSGSRGI